ncbi:hypothetical protein [Natronorubrum bangense]|uniref:Uncharacterized protein n=2 Tax=Natronorubrum bangense TaxID=61858 RepID=L9W8V4_9EURY|nr:hypothetical protein [Natronorubrum bangense]ELY44763.1 hypothetical protein C494_15898 [Natronorubrum bangense JCM 10635]QCC56786.1 hypothetical protein DV706_19795 [Natronorubrum bangense]
MPEDNRFAGLSEAVDEDDSDDSADESTSDAESADGDSSATTVEYDSTADETVTDTESSDDGSDVESADADDPTAFPFDATEKKTVYVRPETIEELEDARALVDAQLRTSHDVRDLTGREFYDAVFRLAADDTDGLIEELLEARDE